MSRLKYLLICAIIWKCIFVAESATINADKLKSFGLDPDIVKNQIIFKKINEANDDSLDDLLEAFKEMQIRGIKRGNEFLGSMLFECAIHSAKSTLEGLMRKGPINDKMKEYSEGYSQTEIASVNETHDEWIHKNLLDNRKTNPNKKRINSKNYIHEISLGFGRCMYELKDGALAYMDLIRQSLEQYLCTLNEGASDKWNIERLEREFCGSISRTYHLVNVIDDQEYMKKIKAIPQDENGEKYFQDALFEVIPTWYLRSQDITYLNIYRYAHHHHYKYANFSPITPYFTMNRWVDKKSGSNLEKPSPDPVVLPVLYNSTECGWLPIEKTIPHSSSAATFSFDVVGMTVNTRPIFSYWRTKT